MIRFHKSSLILGAALLASSFINSAKADSWDKKTTVTFSEPVEIPGAVLPPGQYVIKLVAEQSNRHIVQFMNADQTHVMSTVVAIPAERLRRTSKTAFTCYEIPTGQPVALKMWYYPGDLMGDEFTYPDGRASEISRLTHENVPVADLPASTSGGGY